MKRLERRLWIFRWNALFHALVGLLSIFVFASVFSFQIGLSLFWFGVSRWASYSISFLFFIGSFPFAFLELKGYHWTLHREASVFRFEEIHQIPRNQMIAGVELAHEDLTQKAISQAKFKNLLNAGDHKKFFRSLAFGILAVANLFFVLQSPNYQALFRSYVKPPESNFFSMRGDVLKLQKFEFKVIPPAYTGRKPFSRSGIDGQIRVAQGSELTMKTKWNRSVSSLTIKFGDGRVLAMDTALSFGASAVFFADTTEDFGIFYAGKNYLSGEIIVIPDMPPEVTMLSPTGDISISKKAILTLIARIRDDYGILAARLVFSDPRRPEKRFFKKLPLSSSSKIQRTEKIQYDWSMMEVTYPGLNALDFYIEVKDNNPMNSIWRGKSAIIRLRFDEERHEKIFQMQELMDTQLLNILGKQLRHLSKISKGKKSLSVKERQNDNAHQKRIAKALQNLEKPLTRALKQMRRDPYTSNMAMMEMEQFKKNLSFIKQSFLQNRSAKLSDPARRAKTERQTQEIEKASALSHRILQRQRMENVLKDADEARVFGDSAREALEKLSRTHSRKDLKSLLQRINAARKSISEMMKKMANLRKNFPASSFVNQEAIKKMDFKDVQSSSKKLEKAIQSGKMEDVINSARKMLEDLEKTMDQLSQGLEQMNRDPSFGAQSAAQKMDEFSKRVERMAQGQKKVTDALEKVKSQFKASRKKLEQAALEEIKNKQAALLRQETLLMQYQIHHFPVYKNRVSVFQFQPMRSAMRRIIRALNQRKGDAARKLMEQVLKWMEIEKKQTAWMEKLSGEIAPLGDTEVLPGKKKLNSFFKVPTPAVKKYLEQADARKEMDIIFHEGKRANEWFHESRKRQEDLYQQQQALKKMMKPNRKQIEKGMSEKERQQLKKTGQKQSEIKKGMRPLMKEGRKLSNKTPMMGPGMMQGLRGAEQQMGKARRAGENGQIEMQIEASQSAYFSLKNASKKLSNQAKQMRKASSPGQNGRMSFFPGKGAEQTLRSFRPGRENRMYREGTSPTGRVEIPDPDAYQTPKKLREDVLRALRQDLPPRYKKEIRAYLQRLVE